MNDLVLIILWVCGIILAKGIVSTAAAVLFPPWAWLVVLYNVFQLIGAS